jgi:urease accessory protein UreH
MNNRQHEVPTNESVLIHSVSSDNHIQQDGASLLHTERVLLKGNSSDA